MKKKREFIELRQIGDMTIAQYEDAFNRLIRYMPIYEGMKGSKLKSSWGGAKSKASEGLEQYKYSVLYRSGVVSCYH